MKIFLSWSGERSKAVAELLDDWIQCVLQAVRPWMSARDIDRGSLWFAEISDQLKEVSTGIVCLTKENRERPWILFEAGALARGLSSQRVMTFLVDLDPNDITDPLAQFNHTLPNEAGLRSLVTSINGRLGDLAINARTLENVFETYWPQFEKRFFNIIKEFPENQQVPERTEESKIDEVLSNVRAIDRRLRHLEDSRKLVTNRRTGQALPRAYLPSSEGNAANEGPIEHEVFRSVARKAVRNMLDKRASIDDILAQCNSAGIPKNFVEDALWELTDESSAMDD